MYEFTCFIENKRPARCLDAEANSEKHKYKINIISYLSAIYHSVCAVLRLFGPSRFAVGWRAKREAAARSDGWLLISHV